MPSPFPGMDPYIETPRLWPDFHNALAYEIRALLNPAIQPRYVARLNPYVVYETLDITLAGPSPSPQLYGIRPDVGVMTTVAPPEHAVNGGTMILPAPVTSRFASEAPLELSVVEIRSTAEDRLVTAIEILSPVNKRPSHATREDYLRTRIDLLRGGVHFMEIDLLRAGERTPLETVVPRTHYYVTLARSNRRPMVEVWPIALADALPVVPVPLLPPDPDVALPLGALLAAVYDRGAYGASIDYRQPAPAPISRAEAVWIDQCLREAELR